MFFADMISKISSSHQIHHQIQVFSILKGLPHIYNEFVLDFSEKLPLIDNRIQTFSSHDPSLFSKYIAFDSYFIAYKNPVFFYSTFQTLPNPPFPIT